MNFKSNVSKLVMKKASLLLATVIVGLSTVNVNALDDANTATNISNTNSDITVERISGADRYDTSVKVSEYMINKANANTNYIVVASGDSYPDALSAGSVASEYRSPLIFVSKDKIPDSTTDMLLKSKPKKTILVGGESTVSKDVFSKLINAERSAGKDRVDTSNETDKYIARHKNEVVGHEIYATDGLAVYDGSNFPDALSAIPFMYQYNKDSDIVMFMYPYLKGADSRILELSKIVFGGTSSVPQGNNIDARLAGSDRYKTAVEVAKAYKTMLKMDIDTVVITSGEKYQDALAATPLASSYNGAILLTQSGKLNDDTKEYIESNPNIKHIIIVGGEGSVSSNVENELRNIRAN